MKLIIVFNISANWTLSIKHQMYEIDSAEHENSTVDALRTVNTREPMILIVHGSKQLLSKTLKMVFRQFEDS